MSQAEHEAVATAIGLYLMGGDVEITDDPDHALVFAQIVAFTRRWSTYLTARADGEWPADAS